MLAKFARRAPRTLFKPFSFQQDFDPSKNYYQTLGLQKDASKMEIKKAFAKLAKKYHPDKNKGIVPLLTQATKISSRMCPRRTMSSTTRPRKRNMMPSGLKEAPSEPTLSPKGNHTPISSPGATLTTNRAPGGRTPSMDKTKAGLSTAIGSTAIKKIKISGGNPTLIGHIVTWKNSSRSFRRKCRKKSAADLSNRKVRLLLTILDFEK